MDLMWDNEFPAKKRRWPEPTEPQPPLKQMMEEANDSIVSATDGCRVEPDGICPHGHPSWLLRLGLIALQWGLFVGLC